MRRISLFCVVVAGVLFSAASAGFAKDSDRFVGRWALTIPGGGAGWLGIEDKGGYLDGAVLWGGGSVVPVDSVYVDGDTLYVTRVRNVERKDKQGKVLRTQKFTETITAKVSGDNLELTRIAPKTNGQGMTKDTFTGKRIAPLPPKPDLSKAKRGQPIQLLNGKNLDGWELTSKGSKNGWSVVDGVLVNNPEQVNGRRVNYGNLRTVDVFEDFNIKMQVKGDHKAFNSGVYLRGIYEVQVFDSFGKGLDSHNMGAVYSRITPTQSAEKPIGEWQTLDITLLDRHVTVILNGKTIIDNQPLMGCTGGALWSDETRPGPIYLQGDHSGISYKNIVLTPLTK